MSKNDAEYCATQGQQQRTLRQHNRYKALLFCSKDARAIDNETLVSGITFLFMMLLIDRIKVCLYGREDEGKKEHLRVYSELRKSFG